MGNNNPEEAAVKARKAEKARRMLEKAMRKPLNDTILDVQNGNIDIKDLFTRIEAKVAEKVKEVKDAG